MNRLITRCGAMLAFVIILLTVPTMAQEVITVPTDTTVNVGSLIDPWLQLVLGAATLIIPAVATWAAAELRRRTGIAIQVAHMQTFQQALTNAAGLLVTKASQMANSVTIDVRHPAIRDAINYVGASAPEAIAYFGVTDAAIAEKIIAKLGLINGPTPTVINNATVVGGPPA